jgi:hypothetical protein
LTLQNAENPGMVVLMKVKLNGFKGKFPVRPKTITGRHILEQACHFSHLGCEITYMQEKDINNKFNKQIKQAGDLSSQDMTLVCDESINLSNYCCRRNSRL